MTSQFSPLKVVPSVEGINFLKEKSHNKAVKGAYDMLLKSQEELNEFLRNEDDQL